MHNLSKHLSKMRPSEPNALFVSMNHKHYRIPMTLREQTVQLSENIAPLIHGTYQELKGE